MALMIEKVADRDSFFPDWCDGLDQMVSLLPGVSIRIKFKKMVLNSL